MGSVDIHVKSEPDSCRDLVEWLKQLSDANHQAATAAHKVRSSSEPVWEGKAGEGFRDHLSKCASDVDTITEAVDWLIWGVDLFASDIQTVRAGMRQCLNLAHDKGLTVTGSVIHEPPGSAADSASQGAGGSMPGLDPAAELHRKAEEKLEAYREIQAKVDDERRRERTAHRTLLKAMKGTNDLLETYLASPQTWILRGLVYAGVAHGTSTALAQNVTSMESFVENFKRLSADMPPAAREAHLTTLMRNIGMEKGAAESNSRLVLGGGKTKAGDALLKVLAGTAGGSGTSRLAGVGKLFNVVGVLGAGGFTAFDVAQGKPVVKSVWTNFGGLGFSVAASSAVSMAAGGGGLGAAVGGPVTALSLGVGFAASSAWTYFQDHDLRDLYRDLGGDGGNSPTDQSDERRKARFGR